MIEGEVDLSEGSFDLAVVGGGLRRRCGREGGDRTEQPRAEFDQEDAELEAACGEAVATGATDPLDEAMGAELAEIVAKLSEAVVNLGESVTIQESGQDIAG